MLGFLMGGLTVAVIYTFFPDLAELPSEWLRRAWRRIRGLS